MEEVFTLTRGEIEELKRKANQQTPLLKWSEVDPDRGQGAIPPMGVVKVGVETDPGPSQKVVRFQEDDHSLEVDVERFFDRVRDLEDRLGREDKTRIVLGLVALNAVALCVAPFLLRGFSAHWVELLFLIEVALLTLLTVVVLFISLWKEQGCSTHNEL